MGYNAWGFMVLLETKNQDQELHITPEQKDIIYSWRNFKPYDPQDFAWKEEFFEDIPYAEFVDVDKLHLLLTPQEKLDYSFIEDTLKNDLGSLVAIMTILNSRFKDEKEYDIQEPRRFTSNEEILMFSGLRFLRGYNEEYSYENPYIGQLIAESRKIITIYNIGLLIYTINEKYKPLSHRERSDFLTKGGESLIRCVDKFNPKKGFKFSTYASIAIKNSLTEEHGNDKIIRFPMHIVRKLNNYEKAVEVLLQQFKRFPTINEVAEYAEANDIEIPNLDLVDHLLLGDVTSLDPSPNSPEDGDYISLYDVIPDSVDYTNLVENNILKEIIPQIIDGCLSTYHGTILKMRYGIIPSDNPARETWRLNEIAEKFGLTIERVRQILRASEKTLGDHPYIQALRA